MIGQDYTSFEQYYKIGILPIIDSFRERYSHLYVRTDAKEAIWKHYIALNNQCKDHMRDADVLLDRHKVVACYIYAIEKAGVIFVPDAFEKGDSSLLLLNEKLAFTFGISLLRSLIIDIAERISDTKTKEIVLKAFEGDIKFPRCTHGKHDSNFLWQLFYTKQDFSYNIFLMAETLYLIECYNLMVAGVSEDCLKLDNLKL